MGHKCPWRFDAGGFSAAEVGFFHLVALGELFARAAEADGAGLHHVGPVGHGEGHLRVLLHEQYRGAVLVQAADYIEYLLHKDGREAHGGLVEHQQLGAAHQRAADGEHLLFAAGERARHLAAALLQARELREHFFQVLVHAGAAAGIGAHLQILLYGHLQEDAPALRHLGQAALHDLVRRQAADVLAQELHRAGARAQQAGYGLQRGGLARAVGADERHHLAPVHVEGDALDGVDGAVIDVDVIYFQYLLHAQASFLRPR